MGLATKETTDLVHARAAKSTLHYYVSITAHNELTEWAMILLYLMQHMINELYEGHITAHTVNSIKPGGLYSVGELGAWFRQRLGSYSEPSHYLNRWRHIVHWTVRNTFRWKFNVRRFSSKKMHLKMLSAKWQPICSSLRVSSSD